jgi:hypothetical protein
MVNLQRWPAKFCQLCGCNAAALALVAVKFEALLSALSPFRRQVVAARDDQA